jgi:hypothetical protein
MKKTPNYEYHPISKVFPLISDEGIDELAADIKVNWLSRQSAQKPEKPLASSFSEIIEVRRSFSQVEARSARRSEDHCFWAS